MKHDIAVRIAALPAFLERAEPALRALAACRLSVFGHIGDGNLHLNVLPPAGERLAAFKARAEESLTRRVHDLAVELGGSFSAEHGVGILKAPELARYKSPEALALMRSVKNALDPNGIMNPGKVLTE